MTRSLRAEGHQYPEWLLKSAERLFEVCLPSLRSLCLCVFSELKSRQPRHCCRFIFILFFLPLMERKRWQDDQLVTRTAKGMSGGVFKVSHSTGKKGFGWKKKLRKLLDLFIYLFLIRFLWSFYNFSIPEVIFPSESHLTLLCAWHPVTGLGSVWRIRTSSTWWLKLKCASKVIFGMWRSDSHKPNETRAEFCAEDHKDNKAVSLIRKFKHTIFFMVNLHSAAYKWNIMLIFFHSNVSCTCVSAETLKRQHAIKYDRCV